MHKKERIKFIIKKLEEYYPKPPIPLDHINTYTLLIAVSLSAQSTDKKVNQLTKKLFGLASNPEEMYELGETKIYECIKQLGLAKQKAKNVFALSGILKNNFNGKVPNNYKDLESLPGVGHKTAGVVMSQAFGEAAFPVDTHIHRLSQRWGLTSGISVMQTEKDLKRLFPKSIWSKLHIQIIYYGREHCTARGCDGRVCSICREIYPNRKNPVNCKKP